jgi:hypothetical protein
MQIHTEFRGDFTVKIPRNFAEFRMFFKKFRIPPEVKKALPWTPYTRPRVSKKSSTVRLAVLGLVY